MGFLRVILNSVPYLWIGLNIYAFYESYITNGYDLFGSNQYKMLEHITLVYPFQSANIAHYDVSEFLFFCIVPVYLYILLNRLIASVIAK
jgi:hypothetical protein